MIRELLNHVARVNVAKKNVSTSVYVADFNIHLDKTREFGSHGVNVDIEYNDG